MTDAERMAETDDRLERERIATLMSQGYAGKAARDEQLRAAKAEPEDDERMYETNNRLAADLSERLAAANVRDLIASQGASAAASDDATWRMLNLNPPGTPVSGTPPADLSPAETTAYLRLRACSVAAKAAQAEMARTAAELREAINNVCKAAAGDA